jgi:putative transcriptional regulator
MESLQGFFLLASPHLTDGNFFRSVVLILRHDEEGALGLVLTRPATDDWREEFVGEVKRKDEPAQVFWGGPVPGPLMALHGYEEYSQGEVLPDVHFLADKTMIHKLLKKTKKPVRLFANYSGWGSGQLEDELEAGGWLVTKASAEEVFSDSEELWKHLVHRVGLEILAPAVGEEHIPEDPSWN